MVRRRPTSSYGPRQTGSLTSLGNSVMALGVRIKHLRRLTHLSAWRFIALVVTDPRWQPLYDSLARNAPEDRFNDPVPWITWHAVAVLEQEAANRSGQAVLEWGMGGSTLWYQQRGLRVTAIEHDPQWFQLCRARVGATADLRLLEDWSTYTRPDINPSDFDIFVIDGRKRNECAFFLAEHIRSGEIRKGSVIVFDDTQRSAYIPGVDAIAELCQRHRSFSGPVAGELDQLTTLFWI